MHGYPTRHIRAGPGELVGVRRRRRAAHDTLQVPAADLPERRGADINKGTVRPLQGPTLRKLDLGEAAVAQAGGIVTSGWLFVAEGPGVSQVGIAVDRPGGRDAFNIPAVV